MTPSDNQHETPSARASFEASLHAFAALLVVVAMANGIAAATALAT
jgi:hypothetical protein